MVPLAELKGFAMYAEELSMHSLFLFALGSPAALNYCGGGCFTL